MIKFTEGGAAERVAGSQLLLEIEGADKTPLENLLIDTGYGYEKGEEKKPPVFDPQTINHIVWTHGHFDHVGNGLKYHKRGFSGDIICTKATFDIAGSQFQQNVSGQYIQNNWAKNKTYKSGPNQGEPVPLKEILYTSRDVNQFMNRARAFEGTSGFPYETPIKISDNVQATLYEAGHITGSSQIEFEIKENGQVKKILTAFDLGRTDYHQILGDSKTDFPLLKTPYSNFPKDTDAIIVEATYGNKKHKPLDESINQLLDAINYTAKKGGKIIVPTFSIFRAQLLWYFLYKFEKEGKLPKNMSFYTSSPSADVIARIMLKHMNDFDEEAKKLFENPGDNPFNFSRLRHHGRMDETLRVLNSNECSLLTASSGMGDYGRIKTILRETISDPKNTILKIGYATPESIMGQIGAGNKLIAFHESAGEVPLKAEVFEIGGFSAHADGDENVDHIHRIYNPKTDKGKRKGLKIGIKHGEKQSCADLRERLISEGHDPNDVHIFKLGEPWVI